MSLSIQQDVERWLGKRPEIDGAKKDQILKDLRREADAEGFVVSGTVTRIMGENMSTQIFNDLFERRNY